MNMDYAILAAALITPVLFGFGLLIPLAMDTEPKP